MIRDFCTLLILDLKQSFRCKSSYLQPVMFYILLLMIFPITLNAHHEDLHHLASGMMWTLTSLMMVLSLDKMFVSDYSSGFMVHYVLGDVSTLGFIYVKILSYWLTSALPLILVSPFIIIFYDLQALEWLHWMFPLFIGTWIFSIMGVLTALLGAQIQRGQLLLAFVVLPLYLPVLIFGIFNATSWLLALFFLQLPLMPWLADCLLRMQYEAQHEKLA